MSSDTKMASSSKSASSTVQSKLNFTPASQKEDDDNVKDKENVPVTLSPSQSTKVVSEESKVGTSDPKRDNDDDSVTQRKMTFLEEVNNEDSKSDEDDKYDEQVESEDEVNTVNSDKTTQRGKKKQS